MYEQLYDTLGKFVVLTEKEKRSFSDKFIYREVPSEYAIVKEDSICRELFFLLKGCVRLYYLKNGEELTGFLFTEGMFLNSFESFITQRPSIQILETVEPCEFLVLSKENLDILYNEIPKTNVLFRKLLEQRFIHAQKVVSTFILEKPEERYLSIIAANPSLLQRFPQQVLASFLGITPVSLSRIRKRLSDKGIG